MPPWRRGARSENYGKICQVTTLLSGRYEMGCDYITKPPEVLKPAETYQYRHQPGDLAKAMQSMFRRAREKVPPSAAAFEGIVGREPYPVTEKAREILGGLLRSGVARFRALFRAQPEPVRNCGDFSRCAGAVSAEADLSGGRRWRLYSNPDG